MNTSKRESKALRLLQIVLVFALTALFAKTSFAAGKAACDLKHLNQQVAVFNKQIDPELRVSIGVEQCQVTLKGRPCQVTPFTSYELTTVSRQPDPKMLQAVKIQSFGLNSERTAYILAIPRCSG